MGSDDHTTPLLRRLTQAATLRTLRSGDVMTLGDIAGRSGLSRPTVTSQVGELVRLGWVKELSAVVGGGRPARTFQFNARARYVAGVDIGGHSVRVGVADLLGETLAVVRESVSSGLSGRRRLAAACSTLEEALGNAHVAPQDVCGVTIGTVGVVSADGRIQKSVLPDWSRIDLVEEFAKIVDCPVFVENDVRLAAFAELRQGVAAGLDDFVYVLAGHRTGAALVLGGDLRHGAHGAAAEIGALDVLGWASGTEELAEAAAKEGLVEDDAAARLFDAAAHGDPAAQTALTQYTMTLAQGLSAMVLAVDPTAIVIGGGISGAHRRLLDPLEAEVGRLCLTRPKLLLSTLGRQAVLRGTIHWSLEHLESQLWDSPV